jgi:hypothetical protein
VPARKAPPHPPKPQRGPPSPRVGSAALKKPAALGKPKVRPVNGTQAGAPLNLTYHAPGVYRNAQGLLVDESGILLSFKELKAKDSERFEEVLGGPADTPLDLMLGAMKDPRLPLGLRLDMAVKAAPFMHKKQPIAVEMDPGSPVDLSLDLAALAKLGKGERTSLLEQLKKLGVKL